MPQGSLEDQKPRNKSNVYIAVFAILAFHVVLLGALLLQGCKEKTPANLANNDTSLTTPTNNPGPDLGVVNPFASNHTAVLPPPPLPPPVVPNVVDNTQPPPPAVGAQEHSVAANESFYTIGKKYGVSSTAIAKANPGVDSRKLKIGQKIKIPERAAVVNTTPPPSADAGAIGVSSTVVYEVKKNDSLIKIAKNQGTTVEKLKTANNLKTTMIKPGQKLKIPAKAEASPTGPVATPPPTSTSYITPLPGRATAAL
jgi:LysM repeat protein